MVRPWLIRLKGGLKELLEIPDLAAEVPFSVAARLASQATHLKSIPRCTCQI